MKKKNRQVNMYNCYLEIDLGKLEHNIRTTVNRYGKPTKVMAVVKADAYGHGLEQVAVFLDRSDTTDMFAVADGDEALRLKAAGVKKPILVLSGVPREDMAELIEKDIRLTVYDPDDAEAIRQAAKKLGQRAKIHIKIDTGMGRIGFSGDTDLICRQLGYIASMDFIVIEGIFSHFANADAPGDAYPALQYHRFADLLAQCDREGIQWETTHMCNSAAALAGQDCRTDMIRPGIAMYGFNPFHGGELGKTDLKPCASMYARIHYVKTVPAGVFVSYGCRYCTTSETTIATVAAGYADGFPRYLTNNYEVMVNGTYAKVIGTVCMSQFMIDVTGIPGVKAGDYVMLFGDDPQGRCRADVIAEKGNTIVYEVLCHIGNRTKKIYIKDGKEIPYEQPE